jgi:hypothetical protein
VKLTRSLPSGSQFLSYIDTIGKLDGTKCIIDWKTTTCRYPEQPQGLLALDPQLICYSWMAGISDVALIVFVRKNAPEIQYLKTSIDDQQRREFGQLVEATVNQIEAGQFLPHSGIRFPQNGCVSCAHLGICLGDQQLLDLRTSGPPPMAPKLNQRRALFVLEKIDEILHWERTTERDTRFVQLGRHLCEVRAGQYWRVDNLKSFDEFLEKKFPESRRKAYYLMATHEQLPRQTHRDLKRDGMDQGSRASPSGAGGETELRLCTLGAQSEADAKGGVQTGSREAPDRQGNRALGDALFQGLQEPTGGHRAGAGVRFVDAQWSKGARLLSGDYLCRFLGRRKPGRFRQRRFPTPGPQSNLPIASELPASGVLAADSEGLMNPPIPRQPRLRLD